MPFGMKNSTTTFQSLVNKVISGLDGVGSYVIIHSDTWEEHLRLMRSFFDRLSGFQMTINLNTSKFCHGTLNFRSYSGTRSGETNFCKISSHVNDFPIPSSKK